MVDIIELNIILFKNQFYIKSVNDINIIEFKDKYEVEIDFDEASKYWRNNKKHLGNSVFIYVCGATKKSNRWIHDRTIWQKN